MLARLVGKTFMLSTNLSGPQLICRHFSPDLQSRGLQGAPAGEGLWRGLGLWRSLGHGHGPLGLASFCLALGALVVAVLAELFSRCPADRRAHRGDVAQQEVDFVAAPVVKDHWAAMLQEWHSAPRYCPVPWQWWSFFSAVSKEKRHSLQ